MKQAKITNGQLIFLALSVTLGSSLLVTPGQGAKHDAWLAILAGLGQGIIVALIFTSLAKKFPGKTLIEFNDDIYGPYLGKLISLSYLFYFSFIMTLGLRAFGDFFAGLIFPQTPMLAIIAFMVLIIASAARNGLEVIARCAQFLIPFVIFNILLTTLLLTKNIEINNFLPIMDLPLKDFLKASFYVGTFPFGENIIFLMVFAYVTKQKKLRSSMLFSLLLGGLLLTIAAIRNIGILGQVSTISTYPSYSAVRLINVGEIITRIEILVALNFLMTGFLGISLFYYAIVYGFAQLFHLKTYLPLVLPFGVVITTFSMTQFDSHLEYSLFSQNISPYLATPFQLGIPLLSLIIATIKAKSSKK